LARPGAASISAAVVSVNNTAVAPAGESSSPNLATPATVNSRGAPLVNTATAPYGHDGRSINLNEVILRHGGEALSARNNYAARSEDDRRKVQEFLQTLVLFPPDDTASNLNPGNPNTTNPQLPAEHGNINLGALFQITAEGPE
jgi:hypothetical protein